MAITDLSILNNLEPIANLSAGRKLELANICIIEKVNKNIDPLRLNLTKVPQVVYLIKGDLGLRLVNHGKLVLRGGTVAAKHALMSGHVVKDTIALTDVEILRIDADLLDIMMTWDQLSGFDLKSEKTSQTVEPSGEEHTRTQLEWTQDTSVFSVAKLHSGVFSKLPAANIEEMFKRMTRMRTVAGQVIIEQGAEGDYYYLIERGIVEISKSSGPDQLSSTVAELSEGSAFGDEALVSENKRNATVTMKTDGELLRLNKKDFIELLKEPMLTLVSRPEAIARLQAGAVLVDVRLPSEYKFDHVKGAINIPLGDVRQLMDSLEKDKSYLLYCQTGRRSSAAAFILAQNGFDVTVLAGGTRAR